MSDMTLFDNGAALPAHLANAELDDATKALMGGGGGGGKRISIKGSVFRMIANGEEVAVNEDRAMNFAIVKVSKHIHRTYYAGKYEEGVFSAPACWSEDGQKPHADATDAQSSTCATCEQNVGGSGEGTSRACKYSRRVAVVLEGDMEGDVYSVALPATSIFGKGEANKLPLEAYAKFLGGHNVPVTAVLTEARFDTASPVPKLTFKAVRPLTDDEWATISSQGETPDALQAIAIPSFAAWKDNGDDPETSKPKAESAPKKKASKKKAEASEGEDIAAILDEWDD